ncbi:MAG: hypothetical protein RL318_823 [Fibrobacterota bacterium]
MNRIVLLISLLASAGMARDFNVTGVVGPTSKAGKWDPSVAWNVHALWNVDQMVLVGAGVGYEGETSSYLPVTGRLMVRLPYGRQTLPFVDGDMGVGVRNVLSESFLAWKAGIGIDQKLGDRSSLLLGSGFQSRNRFYIRTGLLLEL